MFGLGMGELVIILVVLLLLFGGSKLPQLGNAMGKAITNFKKGLKDGQNQDGENPQVTTQPNDKKDDNSNPPS